MLSIYCRKALVGLAFAIVFSGSRSALWAQAEKPAPALEADALRRASVMWERRNAPERQVVDQVCLVPDFETFLEAIGTWDERHYFPILIQDAEYSFKFLRAFGPARIVNYPKKAGGVSPLPIEQRWHAALTAVSRSWTSADSGDAVPKGDNVRHWKGTTPPGVVLSAPDSPMLAAAIALAAGHFQALGRLDSAKHHGDVLSVEEARAFALAVEGRIAEVTPKYDRIGDDCDFITLAGDWPSRYQTQKGDNAVDDLLGRFPDLQTRWAYVGRMTGGMAASVYRAMCSLFLQPRSALLFNSYNERDRPWSDYRMNGAANSLEPLLRVSQRSGDRASLTGWHEAFEPFNSYGLVLINTHGSPTQFNLPGGPGQTADVPASVPTAVLMIHSFSAANTENTNTIAGRWLAQGAFLYFGSLNEPYLQAFHPPSLIASLAASHIPFSAIVRQSPPSAFGRPWRLIFLGDPLYRLESKPKPRVAEWKTDVDWEVSKEFLKPSPDDPADVRLNWCVKTAYFRLQRGSKPREKAELADVLLTIDRAKLHEDLRPTYDSFLCDALLAANRPQDLLLQLSAIPVDTRSAQARMIWETLELSRLQQFVSRRDFESGVKLWSETVGVPAPDDFHQQATARIAALADTRDRQVAWRKRLADAQATGTAPQAAPVVERELKRIEAQLATPPSTAR